MFRAFFLPVVLMAMIGVPMLYSHHQRKAAELQPIVNPATSQPWQRASYRSPSTTAQTYGGGTAPSFQTAALERSRPALTGFPPATPGISTGTPPATTVATTPAVPGTAIPIMHHDQAWNQPGMIPDYGKAETLVFAGDAHGPDLSAGPMSFTPTIDLSSLFRYDISKQWITSRWSRVSTCPADKGLHGMRVALVTGTNSWDLHGSLTYWFDASHRVQRITYRGWTGDASRLLQTLQPVHQLQAQPTHWAGLYLSKRSGLMMKHPAVIDKSNPVQQLALILELNNPRGNTPMSDDFQALLPAAMAAQR